MTRSEAIATLTATVAHADEAKLAAIVDVVAEMSTLDTANVLTVAGVIRDMKAEEQALRSLTPRELDLIAQSKADFAEGRTLSLVELEASLDAAAANRAAARRA